MSGEAEVHPSKHDSILVTVAINTVWLRPLAPPTTAY